VAGARAGASNRGLTMRHLRRSFAFLSTVVTGFASQGLTALSGPLVARILGVRGRGEIALVFAVAAVISQVSFGGALPTAIAHQVARRGIAGRDGLRRLAPRWSLLFLGPALVGGGILFFSESGSIGSRLAVGLATVIFTAATIWYAVLMGLLQGEGSAVRLNIYRVAAPAFYLAAMIVLFVIERRSRPITILVIYLATTAVGLLIGFLMLRRPTGRVEDQLDRGDLSSVTRQNFVSSTGPVDGLGIDWLLVGWLLGQFQLGLYATANALANLSSIVCRGIALLVLPRVSAAATPAARRAVAKRWILATLVVDIFIVGVVELCAAVVIRVAFGSHFTGATPCAHVLIAADGLLGFRRVLIAVLQGEGRGATASIIETACVPFLIGGLVLGGLTGGLVGIAWALLATGLLACIALSICLLRTRTPAGVIDADPEPVVSPGPPVM
jgi:O-antigen/teichoic acid export membrane protein